MRTLILVFFSILVCSCTEENKLSEPDQVVVWAKSEPDGLNPIINIRSADSQVMSELYFNVVDYNPETLELEPIYLTKLPEYSILESGPHKGKPAYYLKFRTDATWDNGTPVNFADYAFTIKAIKHPEIKTPRLRAYMNDIIALIPDDDFGGGIVVLGEDSMLGLELVSVLRLMPEYFYDPNQVLRKVSIDELSNSERFLQDSTMNSFVSNFNELKNSKSQVVGGGRYALEEWVSNQFIKLVKKENHWADKANSPLLIAHPKTLIYAIAPDEAAALTQLKSDQFDIMAGLSSADFNSLQEEEKYKDKFNFTTIRVPRYYYIGINTRQDLLSDKKVRKALAYLVDVDGIIASIENGLGERINSPFLTVDKQSTLENTPYQPEKAVALLTEAGWRDSNRNGTLDKEIDGQLKELELNILVTSRKLGRFIASLLKQNAEKVGVKITLDQVQSISKRIRAHEFDLVASGASQSLAPYDPYPGFHTDNLAPGKGNNFGYGDEESDALIEQITSEKDIQKRNQAYLKLEQKMAEEMPMIFLYSPKERIVSKKVLDGVTSMKKPGYFPATYSLVDE